MKPSAKSMNPRRSSPVTRGAWTAVLATVLVVVLAQAATTPRGVVVQNFRTPLEFHKPPYQQQMKSYLEGSRAEPLAGDRLRLSDVRLLTFREQGEPEMSVEAPESIFDRGQKTVSSAGSLRVKTVDGKFAIEGLGYQWTQTNSSLVISNQVRTSVHPELLKADPTQAPKSLGESLPETGPLEITAGTFEYSDAMAAGRYFRGVQVIGTNLFLSSDQLVITVPMQDPQVKAIMAEGNVNAKYADITAEGDLANYWADSGLLRVTGNPRWTGQQQQGSADVILIDRLNRTFIGDGKAYLRLLGKSSLPIGLLPADLKNAPTDVTASNNFVEVHSQRYYVSTNSASFRGDVRVLQQSAGGSPLTMTAPNMDLVFSGTNEIRSLRAEAGVQVAQQDVQLSSGSLDYEAALQKVRFRDKPEWRAGERHGRGDLIEIGTATRAMKVSGNAFMLLPVGDLGGATAVGMPGHSLAANTNITEVPAEVKCAEYTVSQDTVDFLGQVVVQHPQIRWQSDHIQVRRNEDNVSQTLLAEPQVTFDAVDPKGQRVSGTGQRALFTRSVVSGITNSIVELFGSPATLTMTNGMTVRNRKLVLDLGRGTFLVPTGNYRVVGPTNGLDTNMFALPEMPTKDMLLPGKKGRTKK